MLKKNFLTSLLSFCKKYQIEPKSYKKGEIVIDAIHNTNLYVFSSGYFSVWSQSAFGGLHQVGDIESPSVIGEGIFFGEFKKPIRIVTEKSGKIYMLTKKDMANIARENPHFYEIVMRACLAVTNERIREANTERTLGYALVDALEKHSFENIPTLLTILQDTFSLQDVIWIERHEILQDIFVMKYRHSGGNIPVNERIKIEGGNTVDHYTTLDLFPGKISHIFPFVSGNECFGYLIYLSDTARLPGYITRITLDIIPNCIRIVESGWKNTRP